MTPLAAGILGSLAAGLMTSVGAVPVLLRRTFSVGLQDVLLGFAAGVMLAASFFSLIIPGIEASALLYGPGWWPATIAAIGILMGAAAIWLMDRTIPHQHFRSGKEGPQSDSLTKIWLFVFAITIHNIPEGLAVGVGFVGGDVEAGLQLAFGIGLQNAPEGLAVALALQSEGYSKWYAFIVAGLTGLVEPIAGAAGAAAVSVAEVLLPWGMVFAAGAMIYVISHEIIPETHRRGHQDEATVGLMIGLVVMLLLDVGLG
ncbi:ZIP family metal transporter [Aliishimia ponticola]|uniref:ZIP family metal transporter n=1 Tax=Aliishimia ponticola TaxID=2499833 RepID=A0A4S4NBV3_9RHOB|nr:ZIP family metal transporter [Aliishimia ponticola]THH36892.1 ZIP family metal transporter [Aliishimia ponticola]